jgi:hypothetical protein
MEYSDLIAARKQCRQCMLTDPGRLRNGAEYAFDPPVVSHWAQWLGNKTPQLLVIGQDFANIEYFEFFRGQDDPKNKTNRNLMHLLSLAGFHVGEPPAADSTARVYLANAILCMKVGKMNAGIKARWIDSCVRNQLLPLANYLRAAFVVGMGTAGWRAARAIFGLTVAPKLISVAAGGRWEASDGTVVFAVGHCGPLGCANRSWAQQIADWHKIGDFVREQSMSR